MDSHLQCLVCSQGVLSPLWEEGFCPGIAKISLPPPLARQDHLRRTSDLVKKAGVLTSSDPPSSLLLSAPTIMGPAGFMRVPCHTWPHPFFAKFISALLDPFSQPCQCLPSKANCPCLPINQSSIRLLFCHPRDLPQRGSHGASGCGGSECSCVVSPTCHTIAGTDLATQEARSQPWPKGDCTRLLWLTCSHLAFLPGFLGRQSQICGYLHSVARQSGCICSLVPNRSWTGTSSQPRSSLG